MTAVYGISDELSILSCDREDHIKQHWTASLVVATTPMVICQATSTQNDLFCSFWVASSVLFMIRIFRFDFDNQGDILFCFCSMGLAIATKSTALIYLFPFLAVFGIAFIRRTRAKRKGISMILMACLLTLILNLGHFARNQYIFGNPLIAQSHKILFQNEDFGIRPLISNLIKNTAFHVGTPFWEINALIEDSIKKLHTFMNYDIDSPRTTIPGESFVVKRTSTHEDFAGNFLLLILILFFSPVLLMKSSRGYYKAYLAILLASVLLFSLSLKWQPWGARLHLTFFILSSVLVGHGIAASSPKSSRRVVIIWFFLFLCSLPWLVMNRTRPLINLGPPPDIGKHSIAALRIPE
jgi:4-amino-4-deoxy-L-arabinose transferase-like glycosyltransferase